MRRLIVICCVGFFFASPLHAGPLTICGKNQIVKLNVKLHGCVMDFTHNHGVDRRFCSRILGEKRDMYVYLPPGYDGSQSYPLMIWLHGFIQDEKDFLELAPVFDRAIAEGKLPPMIIAAPDGSISGRPTFLNAGSFYINSKAGRFEDYLAIDVWNFLETNFPIRKEAEAHIIAGASMGGFGAFNHAIKYRERFKVVAGIMPPLNLRYADCHGRYLAKFDPDCIGWQERYRPHTTVGVFFGVIHVQQFRLIDPLFGRDKKEAARRIALENPVEMLEAYNVKPDDLHMFIGCGEEDELNVHAQVESFVHFAKKRNLEPNVIHIPHGRHNSETGLKMLPYFEAWLMPLIKPYAPVLKMP